MSGKLDRFSSSARQVLRIASEEAHRLAHNYIGTEHLLLGLVREESGIAGRVLRELGARPDRVTELVERMTGAGRRSASAEKPELTPRTKMVLEHAVEEARKLGSTYISTEHILLGLIRQNEGVAIDVLRQMGLTPERIRRETLRAIQQEHPESRSSAAPASPLFKKERPKTPALDQLATDLTALAEQGKLDPVIGRETEIERVIQILARRTKNNPALIGEPGVGKTAIVEGLAQRIVNGQTPEPLLGKRVMQLDVGSLVAGTMYRGQFEERLKRVIEEVKISDTILFIDEVHMLVGAGSAGSSVDAANILKPALARGEFQCIGATTLNEYRKYIESDAALERRFQPVYVEEPTPEMAIQILQGIKGAYEAHHKLKISDEAIRAAVMLSSRYVADRYLPDKAIDLVDEASSRVRMYKSPQSVNLQRAFRELRETQKKREALYAEGRYEEATELRERERELVAEIEQLRAHYNPETEGVVVTAEDIAEVVSMWTGIPLKRLASTETERLIHLEEELHKRIVGQDEAIKAIAKAIRRARVGLKDPKRPMGSFIFLGPTGVGKTELTKALAEQLFGSEDAMIVLDMSEFMERHTVSRLVGAPPGYVGYDDAGQLTEAVRRRPYSLVVFDEIEKAHPEVFNMLLQIMEEGRLSDARGRKVDFRNTCIIMTSNIGAELIKRESRLGFKVKQEDEEKDAEQQFAEMKEKLLGQLKRVFRPEFLNRLDGVIVFHPLNKEHIRQIVTLELNKVQKRLAEHNITLEVTEAARDYLAEKGYDPDYGARPLRRLVQSEIEDALSDALLLGTVRDNSRVRVDLQEGKLTFTTIEGDGQVGEQHEVLAEPVA
ncbi:MAG: ATP-dependent Clp protease ATP-binding subunit [Thermoflexales bacterium]|nr:ATP-dependent Clp protease ATP-binding subunit [Thermoflexales bacterium]MCS7324153.1 ATP-dependent Clp protease ATP-binding subunit [Thermoflexales bacterium]MDW8053960.1 ATP-dependent Clp protease ATP-binding subunit [Anaerolineae bacterium]MDW8293082.1 ATP-dependent Clp protease ATP-binding subunit [Anaerolineae bacterium]